MLIIPAIDLRGGRCVRLRQGRKDDVTQYDGDPVDVARTFCDQGSEWLHIVDLDGAFAETNSKNRQILKVIVEAVTIPIQFGGGLRSFSDIEQVLSLGVARAVIGTLAVESPEIMPKLIASFGVDRIAVGIDAKNGQVLSRGWEKPETIDAITLARNVASEGVQRIIYTDVARDGMLDGPNIEATCRIARESGLKVTASGGVSSIDDIKRIQQAAECGVDSVIIGRAIHEGRFTVEEAIHAVKGFRHQ